MEKTISVRENEKNNRSVGELQYTSLAKRIPQDDLSESREDSMDSQSSVKERLTYLANKTNAADFEALISIALTLLNTGIELEEEGYEIQAVKNSFFAKEVIKIKIQRG